MGQSLEILQNILFSIQYFKFILVFRDLTEENFTISACNFISHSTKTISLEIIQSQKFSFYSQGAKLLQWHITLAFAFNNKEKELLIPH